METKIQNGMVIRDGRTGRKGHLVSDVLVGAMVGEYVKVLWNDRKTAEEIKAENIQPGDPPGTLYTYTKAAERKAGSGKAGKVTAAELHDNKLFTVYPAKVGYKAANGTLIFWKSYFYRNGLTSEAWAERVRAGLVAAGYTAEVVCHEDRWRSWPTTSYMYCEVRVGRAATPVATAVEAAVNPAVGS